MNPRIGFAVTVAAVAYALFGCALAPVQTAAAQAAVGVVDDWTHHHLVFSNPGTYVDALRSGNVGRWQRSVSDPRFANQLNRRNFRGVPVKRPIAQPAPAGYAVGRAIDGNWSMLPGTGAKGVAGVFPAKYGFGITTATCGDYVVYPTGVAGTDAVPSIVGYTNLYSGCGGSVPAVKFAVNVAGGTVKTSPVLSIDGSQVAFIATISGSANLIVLNVPASSSEVVTLTTAGTVNSPTPCAAPCAKGVPFSGNQDDAASSPFYDYAGNFIYVGDAGGGLYKFQNVFHKYGSGGQSTNTAEPNEVRGSWPVGAGAATSPVYDSVSDYIYFGRTDGTLGRVVSSGGSYVTKTSGLTYGGSPINADLIVDSSAGKVYVFVSRAAGVATAAVYQFGVNFTSS